jgi:hypothetical protein
MPLPPLTWNFSQVIVFQVIVLGANVNVFGVPSFGIPENVIELPSLKVTVPPLEFIKIY